MSFQVKIDSRDHDWRQVLNRFVTEEIDGRFWLEDRIEEVLRGHRDSAAFSDLEARHEDQLEEVRESAFDEGWHEGWFEAEETYKNGVE